MLTEKCAGVSFHAESPDSEYRQGSGRVVIQVRDNGIGIAPQYKDRIFQLFHRLHSKSEYPGTGAGLAIVRKIVESHGGSIRVESAEGSGATFEVELPGAPFEA